MEKDEQKSSINCNSFSKMKSILVRASGRIRPVVIGLIVLVAGLLMHRWWWEIGAILLIVIFVDAYFRYVTLD